MTCETNLVITRAKDKSSVRVQVQNTLDDLALVDRHWADFEILFAHKHYERASGKRQ
jgi:hypothetical protein